MTPFVVYNGATGGLGRHLGPALAERGLPATALGSRLGETDDLADELERLPVEPGVPVTLLQSAGIVSVDASEGNPERAFDVNVTRTGETALAFTDWTLANGHEPGIVFVSSGHVYAPPQTGQRLNESSPVEPRSVYAATKLEGEERLRALAADQDAALVIGRVFGLIGPGQAEHYLLPGLIRRVRSGDLSNVPGLNLVRDYLDARDVARHLAGLASDAQASPEMVNVCSGEETRIGDLLDELLAQEHRDDPAALEEARGQVSAAPGRPTDVTWSVGDPSLLADITDFPIRSISIAETLAEAVA